MRGRFDTDLMDPPALQPAADPGLQAAVRAWCEAGAFTPPWQPLAAASIVPQPGLEGLACELDGSHALARLGRLRGLAWRARLLLAERLPGRGAKATDPWDCGWWRSGALRAAQAFRPRRATLLMVRPADAGQAGALMEALRANGARYTRPVRVLVLSEQPAIDLGPGGQHFCRP